MQDCGLAPDAARVMVLPLKIPGVIVGFLFLPGFLFLLPSWHPEQPGVLDSYGWRVPVFLLKKGNESGRSAAIYWT